ncbi:RNA polymerase sigma factor [Streptomyces spiralis]
MIASTVHPPPAAADCDDATLIAKSLSEPEWFAQLYDRHAADLHRYVLRRLGSSVADDVVSETFLIAFRRRGRYNQARPQARPWLYGIAVNVMAKHRRSELRAYRALARTGVDPVAQSWSDAADTRVVAAAARSRLAAALRALSDRDRDVFLLIAWADFSYEEVATALAVPLGTVGSRLHRARRKMRNALGDVDPMSMTENLEETSRG